MVEEIQAGSWAMAPIPANKQQMEVARMILIIFLQVHGSAFTPI